MTPQQRMKSLMEKSGIAHKEIKVFGSQILITCYSLEAANKWVSFVSRFATVRGVVESVDELKDQAAAYQRRNNPGLVKSCFTEKVWRVGAYIT